MEQNIFEEYQTEKKRLIKIAAQARANNWINEKQEQEIIEKINNSTLTLGVIGQMKCGKSTFLNTFVFGDTVLPAATTPMTAALSIITYGPEKKIEVEFYTSEEWEEQKYQASRNFDDVRGNEMEESKIKAAKELVSKACNIPGNIHDYLGNKKKDNFNNLKEYVGADGKYISITKSVTLYYPHDYLKGVEIVDTPGFNDPIVSREERTKNFLKRADVVLLMLYAGRAFDSTDKTILFKNVRECGIGKILIGVNKYDIAYGNGELESNIISTVKEQIEKACSTSGDEALITLIKERDPILLSAEMALMSQLPMSRVMQEFATSWNNVCRDFEISSQPQMAEKSHIAELINAIKDIIQRNKIEVLLKKPYNAIRGAALTQKESLETELQQIQMLINNLQQPNKELEERLEKLKKANKRMSGKLEVLDDDIDLSFSELLRKGRHEMEDEVDAACKKLDHEIDNLKRMAGTDALDNKWRSTWNILVDRTLKRCAEKLTKDTKRQLNSCVREFCEETENILLRNIKDEDFDARDFMKRVTKSISESLDYDMYSDENDEGNNETEDSISFLEAIGIVCAIPIFPAVYLGDKIGKALFGNNDVKRELHKKVENARSSFNCEAFLEGLKSRKGKVIEAVRQKVLDELISPLQTQLEEILSNTQDREQRLVTAQEHEKEINSKLLQLNIAFESIFAK